MVGWREAGVLGASVAVAGGVAYLIWNYASFSGKKTPEARAGGDGGAGGGQGREDRKEVDRERSRRRKEEEEGEEKMKSVSPVAAPPPVAAAKPTEPPQVRGVFPGLELLRTAAGGCRRMEGLVFCGNIKIIYM